MRSRRRGSVMLAGVALVVSALSSHTVRPADPAPSDRIQEICEALGLSRCSIVTLPRSGMRDDRDAIRLAIPIEGSQLDVALTPHSIRAPGYQLLVQRDGGPLLPAEPGTERTYRGNVDGVNGSRAAGSLLDDGWHITIDLGDSGQYWIEPVPAHLGSQDRNALTREHVVYASRDVLPDGGTCGMPDKLAADQHLPSVDQNAQRLAGTPCIAELACDADIEYYNDMGSDVAATEAFITNIINNVNVQYERDVDLTHQITAIIVRTGTPNSDPYSTNSATGLLCQFITEWTNNQGGIQRDAAQLFTGRMIVGGTIGIAADIGDIGNLDGSCTCHPLFGTDGSYCLVQNIGGGDACRSDLSAHELGHLWSGLHCSCSNPAFTMNPSITCANRFRAQTISLINTYKAGRTTLGGPCAGAPPSNDVCEGAIDINETSIAFSNFGAGTECPGLPASCDEGAGDNLEFFGDIWFRYTSTCFGDVTISLCNSNFDTRLVVYADNGCFPDDADLVACDDDFCGPGSGSQVTISTSPNQTFLIRVGGFSQLGSGTMHVLCLNPCPADVIANGTVDVQDLLALLAGWGLPGDSDIDNNGTTDVADLLLLLGAWGPCA